MVIEKLSSAEKKKKTIFGRLTNKFINQQRSSKRDQSVQTTSVLINKHLKQRVCSPENLTVNTQIPTYRRRSSLKTFLTFQSPKLIPIIHRVRRRSINLKTPKRLSSECLVNILSLSKQVALIRKIPPVSHMDTSIVLASTTSYDETTSRDELFSIGPIRWSTPNRTNTYKTSSPYNNNSNQLRHLCTGEQLSFSDIFDRID